ncbi:hypothetical protein Bca4012_085025 [Brassica carinata]
MHKYVQDFGPCFRDPVYPQTTIDEVIDNAPVIHLQKFMQRKFDHNLLQTQTYNSMVACKKLKQSRLFLNY